MEREEEGFACQHCGALVFAEELIAGLSCPACSVSSHLIPIWLLMRWDGERVMLDWLDDEDKYGYCPMDDEEEGGSLDNDETGSNATEDDAALPPFKPGKLIFIERRRR